MNSKPIHVVGVPRSGSRTFCDIFEDFGETTELIRIENGTNHGKQHMQANDREYPSLLIYRDFRDIAVSYYFYVLNRWKTPKGKHQRHEEIYSRTKKEALNWVIDNLLLSSYRMFTGYLELEEDERWIVAYEEFFDDPAKYVFDAIHWLGLDAKKTVIGKIVNKYTFSKVHGAEPVHNRKGESRQFEDHLTEEQIKRIKEKYPKGIVL